MVGNPQGLDPGRCAGVPGGGGRRRRVATTTKEETQHHKGCVLNVSAAMKETMEAERWVPEPRVCHERPDSMPSDTRLHCLVLALLGLYVQVQTLLQDRLWADHQHM